MDGEILPDLCRKVYLPYHHLSFEWMIALFSPSGEKSIFWIGRSVAFFKSE